MVSRWPVLSDRVGRHEANDCLRKAEPLNADDGFEKIARIEAALAAASECDRRLLDAELLRLKGKLR